MDINKLKRDYDKYFRPDAEYLKGMPDLQNGDFKGGPIERVGISGFKLPLNILTKSGDTMEVMATIDGMVSLDADKKCINMSRILRSFYKFKDETFTLNKLRDILDSYKQDLDSFDATININFQYRMWLDSLVSTNNDGQTIGPEGGWQYYNITFTGDMNKYGDFRKTMVLDFIYSSTCPCSTELSMYNANVLGVYGAPHAQRSTMRCYIDFDGMLWIEDVVSMLRDSLKTETQVFVKREDEANFSWLCGSDPKFVEDAIRRVADAFDKDADIVDLVEDDMSIESIIKNDLGWIYDYKLVCSHNESLHSHNAIAVLVKDRNKDKDKRSRFSSSVSIDELKSLVR